MSQRARQTRPIPFSLNGYELPESIGGSVLLRYATDCRFDVCLSWRAISAGHVRRDARFGQYDDAGRRLDSACRRLAYCLWIAHAVGCIHLQWRNGSGLFHDSRGQRPNSDGEVFSDFERRTASIEQRRTGCLLLLVFLVRRLLWRWTLEYRRLD